MVDVVAVSLEDQLLVSFEGSNHSWAIRVVLLKLVHRRHFVAQEDPVKICDLMLV